MRSLKSLALLATVAAALVEADAPTTGNDRRAPSSWKTSGALWGVLWIAGTALATWTVPVGAPAFGVLLMLGAVALVVPATLAARHVEPECDAPPASLDAGRAPRSFQVLVHGSRSDSDVALARAILAARSTARPHWRIGTRIPHRSDR